MFLYLHCLNFLVINALWFLAFAQGLQRIQRRRADQNSDRTDTTYVYQLIRSGLPVTDQRHQKSKFLA